MKNILVCTIATLALTGPGRAQDLVFSGTEFADWDYPQGLVTVTADGLEVKRFGGAFNAVANAREFRPRPIGDYGLRFVRAASNHSRADLAGDQDPATWWQPDPADGVNNWWLEIDLGRAVVADKVRVIFPDQEGARPFSFFSVYASPGIAVFGGQTERINYNRLGRPVNNNTATEVEFDLSTTKLSQAVGEHLISEETLDYDMVRFIRFEAAGLTPDAALAEIEVNGQGFNLATMVATEDRIEDGRPHWGGRTWTSKARDCPGCGKGSGAAALIDQDIGFRGWNIEASDKGNWRNSGVWSVIDFGNVFRVDRVIWVPIVSGSGPFLYGYQRDKQGSWRAFEFLTSDGTPSNSADPEVEGPFKYELLSAVDNSVRNYLFDFRFPPRPLRLLLWRVTRPEQHNRAAQLFIFHSEGYPAQIELGSADIFLGGARSMRFVEWDADLPPGTRIEIQTQTGNGFETIERYFLKNGKEVTKEAYEAAKKRNRGDIVEERVRDDTWSSWSESHRFSGQEFLSPTPRQWLRTRVRLISDDPEAFPNLRGLTFVASPPLITAGLSGRIFPREAAVDSLQHFRYTIVPEAFDRNDAGFDRVIIALPRGSEGEFLAAAVAGTDVAATGLTDGDSLIVDLPPPLVRRDSVEVSFSARVSQSPTAFNAFVGKSDAVDNIQGVVPAEYGADLVFVPGAVEGGTLVRNITHTAAFSPNGDGVNDFYELSFTVVKTQLQPVVRVYNLAGRQVAELANARADRALYRWDGRGPDGAVPPGVYMVRIAVDADALDERVHRLVHIAY